MGGMLPTAAMSALQFGMDMAQQNASQAEAKADARAQTQQIQQQQEVQSRERRDQLRRALATQRARFGAQGIAAGGGSAEAALGGLEAEAARDEQEASSVGTMRINRIDDQLDWQKRRNLLDASSPRYRSAFSLMQRSLRSVPLLDD
ncbi:MAG: hypothetical protein IPK78_01385 [Rhodospirillales bacterium]|nr:hypothetical protein [Rhodospirillales bacterium]